MSNFIITRSGLEVNAQNPTSYMISIEDIAFSLARIRRFNGHTDANCSVALHSVIVSHNVPDELALYGLLHDAHEAYTGDISTPFKNRINRAIEDKFDDVIYPKFGLGLPDYTYYNKHDVISTVVKFADLGSLLYEKNNFLPYTQTPWDCFTYFQGIKESKVDEYQHGLYFKESCTLHEELFLRRFIELMGAVQNEATQ